MFRAVFSLEKPFSPPKIGGFLGKKSGEKQAFQCKFVKKQ